ncbi:hypothetical protein BHE74_00013922 [Ensete ventricosum]|nr:hypothetical protein GW17_00030472 [Ensete ventricosum]RWW77883.1 hypothetical protein BHE74_00013922 [Ensete ventricosum]RZS04766.1 hypothetical protein BHM03_00035150 [Ensete ventricosum]
MASLNPGVLLRLLQDIDRSGNSPRRPLQHGPPAVLQVTGIVPAVAGSDLSPDRGFYVKVSDSSHCAYVSLPADLNDLILADRLQLGQLIHVRRLDPASPVPVLREFRLLEGRHPCLHDTVDLTRGPSRPAAPSATPPRPPPEKNKRQLHCRSNSFAGDRSGAAGMSSLSFTAEKRGRRSSDILNELKKFSVACMDENIYDSDDSRISYPSSPASSRFSYTSTSSSSSFSSSSSSSFSSASSACTMRPRKSWDATGRIPERRRGMEPTVPSQSASVSCDSHWKDYSALVSPNRFAQHVSSTPQDDASWALSACPTNTQRSVKALVVSAKRKLPDSDKACTESDKMGVISALQPPSLMKHAKVMLRQRDSTLQAAVDALLEASAAEKLSECFSMYSELQSDRDGDPRHTVNGSLTFHHKLAETRLIAQALARSSQPNSCSCNSSSPAPLRSVARVASERQRCATSWIKAALKSDLSRLAAQQKTASELHEAPPSNADVLSPTTHSHRPKNTASSMGSNSLLLASSALQCEYNRWFLRYIDKFLDSIQGETGYGACELEVASLLCQLKRVDDWLNDVTSKEVTEDEAEACERVRRKIYGILLRHVESAAIALESMSTPEEEMDRDLMLCG